MFDEPSSTQPNTQLPASYGLDEVIDPATATAAYQNAGLAKMAGQAGMREQARSLGYVELDPADAELWQQRFSTEIRISDIHDLRVRPDFVAALKRAQQSKAFTSVECWTVDINRSKSREYVIVGLIAPENVTPGLERCYSACYIIDQHVPKGEQPTTTEHLRKRYKYSGKVAGFSPAQPTNAKIALGACVGSLAVATLHGEDWHYGLCTIVACFVAYGAQYRLTNHEEDFAEELRVSVFYIGVVQVLAVLIALFV
jgi:hypothetical protein